ncbi:sortase [Leuconostoc mesenteroides]|uniref:sortase n=2 Tax=Leuconostoc mesenteroides TaxID=1245 RepID=UPI002367955C|nr:sortase [Leuconostoc mesenteroides]
MHLNKRLLKFFFVSNHIKKCSYAISLQGRRKSVRKSSIRAGTHSVISAHCGLASRMLFTNLNHVKKNDTFVLTVFHKKLAYKVFKIEVVKPEDYQGLQVEPDKDLVTLITCTPYMVNSHRLLVTGYRVPYNKNMAKNIENSDKFNNIKQALIIVGIILLIALQFIFLYKRIIRIKLAKKKFDL